MNEYNFVGADKAELVKPVDARYSKLGTAKNFYDYLLGVWCAQTCAPRMRENWSLENPTLGQCSITAFLVQDIYGGDVYGVLRPGGNYHCYNVVDGITFDLTSEQFGEEAKLLSYENNPLQSREVHFAKEEKYQRYLYLKEKVEEYINA
ncbi:MAG: hypothetical protein MJ094_08300 [Saccharofermentans sp.]|nr:hypothetical protein [Saccharofermentans sp.]